MVRFMQRARSLHYMINIFCFPEMQQLTASVNAASEELENI